MASINQYYDHSNFLNVFYALLPALDTHFATMLFKDDLTRIITASNNYAFRKRSEQNKTETSLDLPFMNYRRKDLPYDSNGLWSSPGYQEGIFVPEIQKKLRFTPTEIEFEATAYFQREDDLQYAYNVLRWDADSITQKVNWGVEIDDNFIPLHAYLNYKNLQYDPEYEEKDWLEKNKIHTISMDFTIKTLLIRDDSNSKFAIPETILFNFYNGKLGKETYSLVEAQTFIHDYYAETVTKV